MVVPLRVTPAEGMVASPYHPTQPLHLPTILVPPRRPTQKHLRLVTTVPLHTKGGLRVLYRVTITLQETLQITRQKVPLTVTIAPTVTIALLEKVIPPLLVPLVLAVKVTLPRLVVITEIVFRRTVMVIVVTVVVLIKEGFLFDPHIQCGTAIVKTIPPSQI